MADVLLLGAKGTQALKAGDTTQAREAFAKLCELDSSSQLWPSLLARVYLSEGSASEALAISDKALRGRSPEDIKSSKDSELLLVRGRAHLALDSKDKAKGDFERVLSLGGIGSDAKKELADCFRQLGLEVPAAKTTVVPTSSPQIIPTFQPAPTLPKPSPQAAAPSSTKADPPSEQRPVQSKPASNSNSLAEKTPPPAALEAVKAARKLEQKIDFIEARQKCELALKLCPGLPDAVLCLARMALKAGVSPAEMTKILKSPQSKVLTTPPWCIEALSIRAAAAAAAEDWSAAAEDLDKALKAAQKHQGKHDGPSLTVLKGRLSKALWKDDDREEATALAQSLLDAGEVTQREASEVACAILLHKGDTNTAIGVMVRCLIAHRTDPSRANSDLVCGVMKQCSIEHLLHVLAPQYEKGGPEAVELSNRSSVAEVLGYVGLILKERSEIIDACRCYRISVSLAPTHASLVLNLMHTHSLRDDILRSLAFGAEYFARLKDKSAAALIMWTLMCERGAGDAESDVAFDEKQFDSKSSFHDTMAIGFTVVKLLYFAHPYRFMLGDAQEAAEAAPCQPSWQKQMLKLDVADEKPLAKLPVLRYDKTYDAVETKAHFGILKGLCQVLDNSRTGHELHQTNVRNEHAYFACVNDTLRSPPTTPCDNMSERSGSPIYVVGDSHVISCGWQTVFLPDGEEMLPHQLVPCLVTGCKLWHLRKKSTFYTKFTFWDRIATLPAGSALIFVLGEIDCREGVLKAVQYGIHNSVESALSAVLDIYMTVLQEVRKKLPDNRIFVHPVANVIPLTRFLTMPFNKLLEARRAAFDKIGVKVLRMASVFEGEAELTPEATSADLQKLTLLPSLQMDGTHMNPTYVRSHLNPALVNEWGHSR